MRDDKPHAANATQLSRLRSENDADAQARCAERSPDTVQSTTHSAPERPAESPRPVAESQGRQSRLLTVLQTILPVCAFGAAVAAWMLHERDATRRGQTGQEYMRTRDECRRAEEQRKQADRERGGAEQARDLACEREHAERVERARALARRGLLAEAGRVYDHAIAADRADVVALRIERLRCLFTPQERARLAGELDRLKTARNLGPSHTALLLLHRADYLLCDWERQKQALDLLTKALAAPAGLAGADRAYAEGLAAEEAEAAVARFRAALEIEPFHHRANTALLSSYLFLGRFDEARKRADFMRQAFRDDPLPAFADAWIAICAGDRAACFRHLEPAQLGEPRAGELRTFFTVVGDLVDLGDQVNLNDPAAVAVPLYQAGLHVKKMSAVARPALAPFGLSVPVISRFTANLESLRLAVLDLVRGRTAATAAALEAAGRIHPDGMFYFVQATALWKQAAAEKQDHASAVRLVAEARDLFSRSADAPTILARASWRYEARLAALMLDHSLAAEPAAADPERAARLRDHSERAAEFGRQLPKARRKLLPLALETKAFDPECARFLVAAWLRDEPDEMPALRLQAQLDVRAGDWTAALRHADRILRARPDDRDMQNLRKAALAGLRKQAKE